MKVTFIIIIAITAILSVCVLLLEILDSFFYDLIHNMRKDNAIKNYQMVETTCNMDNGKPDGECFVNAFDECKYATIKHMDSTFDGDPVFYYAAVLPDDSCQIQFEKDISQDRWKGVATKGLIQKTCTDVLLEKNKIQFQCYDEDHTIYLR